MSGERYVLDTSAVLTLIEDEPGADRVEEVMGTAEILLPWTVLMELVYITRRERGEGEAETRYALLKGLPSTILSEMTESVLLTAARLKAGHRVSFADAIIAAYAVRFRAVLLHKDPEYETLQGELGLEALPYKT